MRGHKRVTGLCERPMALVAWWLTPARGRLRRRFLAPLIATILGLVSSEVLAVSPQIWFEPDRSVYFVGDSVQERGSGFTRNGRFTVEIKKSGTVVARLTGTADGSGSWTRNYRWSAGSEGSYTYRAKDESSGVWSNTKSYGVVSVTIRKLSPDTQITVSPGQSVTLKLFLTNHGAQNAPIRLKWEYGQNGNWTTIANQNYSMASGDYEYRYTWQAPSNPGVYDLRGGVWSQTSSVNYALRDNLGVIKVQSGGTGTHLEWLFYDHMIDRFGQLSYFDETKSFTNAVVVNYKDSAYPGGRHDQSRFRQQIDSILRQGHKPIIETGKIFLDSPQSSWAGGVDTLKNDFGWRAPHVYVWICDEPELNLKKDGATDTQARDRFAQAISILRSKLPNTPLTARFAGQLLNESRGFVWSLGIPSGLEFVICDAHFGTFGQSYETFVNNTVKAINRLKSRASYPIVVEVEAVQYPGHPMNTPEHQDWYWNAFKNDSRVVGLLVFMYGSGTEGVTYTGCRSRSELIDKHRAWGTPILRNNPLSPVRPPAEISVEPETPVDFGEVVVAETREIDAFTVTNSGGERLTGSASVSAPFAVVSGGNYDLDEDESQVVRVRFAPPTTGDFSQTVTFTGGGGETRTVRGRGALTPVQIAVEPTHPVDFGQVIISTSRELEAFTVRNPGSVRLIGSASVSQSFAVVSGGNYDLGPGQSQLVKIRFTPTERTVTSQTVTFTGGRGQLRTVLGTGIDIPVASVRDHLLARISLAGELLTLADRNADGQIDIADVVTLTGTTGRISVTVLPIEASWRISGPTDFSGQGARTVTDALAGEYTIQYLPLAGYRTPSPETRILVPNATVSFTGVYQLTSQWVLYDDCDDGNIDPTKWATTRCTESNGWMGFQCDDYKDDPKSFQQAAPGGRGFKIRADVAGTKGESGTFYFRIVGGGKDIKTDFMTHGNNITVTATGYNLDFSSGWGTLGDGIHVIEIYQDGSDIVYYITPEAGSRTLCARASWQTLAPGSYLECASNNVNNRRPRFRIDYLYERSP